MPALRTRLALACALAFAPGALLACGPADEPAAKTDAAKPAGEAADAAMIGYDLRRLRPRNEESLADMFERLRKQALGEGKRTLVLFSADWCAPCRRLEAELGNLQPAAMIGDARIFELKEEEWQEATRMDEFNALRTRWYPRTGSYPVLVLLDERGEKIEEMKEAIERLEREGTEATLPNWLATSRPSAGS